MTDINDRSVCSCSLLIEAHIFWKIYEGTGPRSEISLKGKFNNLLVLTSIKWNFFFNCNSKTSHMATLNWSKFELNLLSLSYSLSLNLSSILCISHRYDEILWLNHPHTHLFCFFAVSSKPLKSLPVEGQCYRGILENRLSCLCEKVL